MRLFLRVRAYARFQYVVILFTLTLQACATVDLSDRGLHILTSTRNMLLVDDASCKKLNPVPSDLRAFLLLRDIKIDNARKDDESRDGIRWAVTLSRDTRFASIYFLERHGICELISVHWLIAEPAEAWRIRR